MTRRSKQVVVAVLAALSVATLGGLMTDIGGWYLSLEQPAWKPPDWAFGPIWTTIFALSAAAGVIGWRKAVGPAEPARSDAAAGLVEATAAPDNAVRSASLDASPDAGPVASLDATRAAHPQATADALRKRRREWMLVLFAANAFLNVFWSLLYFRLHRPDWALLEVPFLWLSVLALIVWLWPFARTAAWLLVPYLIWVALAAALNWQTVALNGPFAGR